MQSQLDEKIYSIEESKFDEQLKLEQERDPIISHATQIISAGNEIREGCLKMVTKQLITHRRRITHKNRTPNNTAETL